MSVSQPNSTDVPALAVTLVGVVGRIDPATAASSAYSLNLNYRVGQKNWGHRLTTIILSNLNRLKEFTGRFLGRLVVIKIPPHLATLPSEILTSAEQAINDKLQGSVATYLRCGGVVDNQIRKGLLLSLSVTFFLNR